MMLAAVAVQTKAGGRRFSDRPRVEVIAKCRGLSRDCRMGLSRRSCGPLSGRPGRWPKRFGIGKDTDRWGLGWSPPQTVEGRHVQGVEQPSIRVNSARCASVTGNADADADADTWQTLHRLALHVL